MAPPSPIESPTTSTNGGEGPASNPAADAVAGVGKMMGFKGGRRRRGRSARRKSSRRKSSRRRRSSRR